MQIQNRTILITGANRGMGLAFAKKFAQEGGIIHTVTRQALAPELQIELKKLGAKDVQTLEVDLSQPQKITEFANAYLQKFGAPDVLVNNAGLLTGGLLEDQPLDEIYKMMQVNLLAVIHLSHAFLPAMLARRSGKIVNNASVSGIMSLPCASTYSAAKGGVVNFSESLRNELKGTGVSCLTLVTPGVQTEMFDDIYNKYSKNLKLTQLSAIPAEDWAEQVVTAIKDDREILWPSKLSSKISLLLARHTPKIFGKMVRTQFHR